MMNRISFEKSETMLRIAGGLKEQAHMSDRPLVCDEERFIEIAEQLGTEAGMSENQIWMEMHRGAQSVRRVILKGMSR